jgi:SpoVK/Ycf46/Vps4 family AAA+-type ATPase
MFYDRDSSRYNWEVRDVNVLLQQLEHFEGVCILATNRKITLDKALERRISLKIEFERPGRKERRQIWEKFLPKKLPLARDVDFNQLSEADLAGGEIKNVVLNAARLALQRDEQGPVGVALYSVCLWAGQFLKELLTRLESRGWQVEWARLRDDLDALEEMTVTTNGRSFVVRSQTEGDAGKAFQAVGIAFGPAVRLN